MVFPPCSKALSTEHRPKFCSPSPAMVTSPCEWKILELEVKPWIINQSSNTNMNWTVEKNVNGINSSQNEGLSPSGIALSFDWLIYCFTSRSRIFHLYGDVAIAGEGLQNLGLYSARRSGPLSREGSLSCHTCFDTGLVFPVSSEGPPHSVASYDTRGVWRIYSNPDPHGCLMEMRDASGNCLPCYIRIVGNCFLKIRIWVKLLTEK